MRIGKNPPKMKIISLFCNRFTYLGLAIIFASIIIHLLEGELFESFPKCSPFWVSLFEDFLSTVGIALLIGSIFDLAKNSEEFVNSVSSILSNIVVSKSFLNTLNESDKRQALELILQPSGDQLQQYSNINYYFQKKIDEAVAIFDTNFKSHLSLEVIVFKDKEKAAVCAESHLQYRIYKINNEFQPIHTWFEQPGSAFVSAKIICNSKTIEIDPSQNKALKDDSENHTQIPYEKTFFEIPKEYQNAPYVTVQYNILEPGFDHWMNYTWTSLTPYDGLNFSLTCKDNLTIRQHCLFDKNSAYNVSISDDKTHISILSTEWLNSYTGLSIIVGDTSDHMINNQQD